MNAQAMREYSTADILQKKKQAIQNSSMESSVLAREKDNSKLSRHKNIFDSKSFESFSENSHIKQPEAPQKVRISQVSSARDDKPKDSSRSVTSLSERIEAAMCRKANKKVTSSK